MPKRKYIYIAVAAVLLTGLAITAAVLRIQESPTPIDGKDTAVLQENGAATAAAPPDAESPDSEPLRDSAGTRKTAGVSIVRSLLDSFKKTELFGNYLLKGVIVSDASPELSRATIEDMSNGTSRIYSLNATLSDNSRIVEINRDNIVLQKSGVRKRIDFDSGSDSRGRRGNTGWRNSSKGYSKIRDNEYNLNPYQVFRGDADSILDFSMKVQSLDNDVEGIQISDIKNNSLARELGLKEKDVLLEVNGEPLDSLYRSIKACINANYSDDLRLKVYRDGRIVYLTYHLYWQGKGTWTTGDILSSKAVSSLFKNGFTSGLF